MTDCDVLEANIRNLQRENATLRESLRDRFAMAVMTGLMAKKVDDAMPPLLWAEAAFAVADAMLKVRQQSIFQPSERTAP